MADLYKTTKSIPSSSISSPFPTEYEDISAFLYHLLDNPNSASSPTDDKHIRSLTSFSSPAVECCEPKVLVEDHVRSYADKECGNPVAAVQSTVSFDFFDSPGLYYAEEKESARKAYCSASVLSSDATVSPARGTKVPPEPDDDEFRGDSEVEGLEASAMSLSPAPSRSSSKRSRAAEIHNLSEKRRRSRINEKMKALQNLIPNSNKTDKASMLDEAIEYLKQLQLQVQMLTMRNGLSPHPFYLSGALESTQLLQIGSSFHECSEMLNTDRRTDIFLVDQRNSTGTTCDLPNQNTSPSQPVDLPIISGLNGPDNFEPSVEAQFGPFNLSTSRQEICRVDMSRPDLGVNFSLNNSSSILSSSSKISDG